jgi:hypothetical protein
MGMKAAAARDVTTPIAMVMREADLRQRSARCGAAAPGKEPGMSTQDASILGRQPFVLGAVGSLIPARPADGSGSAGS